jgi:hypothetical protein
MKSFGICTVYVSMELVEGIASSEPVGMQHMAREQIAVNASSQGYCRMVAAQTCSQENPVQWHSGSGLTWICSNVHLLRILQDTTLRTQAKSSFSVEYTRS